MSVLTDGAGVVTAAVVWLNAAQSCWAVWWAALGVLPPVAKSLQDALLQY